MGFNFITAKAKRIKAVLKAMLKLMFKDGSGPDVNLLIVNSFRVMTIIDVRLYEF